MRRSLVAASLLITASCPGLAQSVDALRDGLAHMPSSVLAQNHGDLAYFVDIRVISELAARDGDENPYMRVMPFADINALQSIARTEREEWEAKAGTPVAALRYFTGYGRAPNAMSFWGLENQTAAAGMMGALKARGFVNAGPDGVIGNGEQRRADPPSRDIADPWRTLIGTAQFTAHGASFIVAIDHRTLPRPA